MKKFHRNIVVLCVAISLAAINFAGNSVVKAQTKTAAKTAKTAAPTPPKNQKSTAKPATKTTIASAAAPKMTTAKTSVKPKTPDKLKASDKSKTATKSSPEKNKPASAKATPNSQEKTVPAAKGKSEKTVSAKSVSPAKTTAAKPAAKTSTSTKTASTKTAATTKTATVEKSSSNSQPIGKISAPKTTAPKTAPVSAAASPQIIVSAVSARVRSEPTAGASAVSTVNIGRILPVLEENSIWYRVRLADEKSGWISKQTAAGFDDSKRAEIYQKIVARYFKGKMDFATAAQIFDFLTVAAGEIKKPNAQADLSLRRLQALSSALKAVPPDESDHNPYKDFLKTNEKEVVYSEPSGEWLVRSNVFWELHARFKDSESGEEIAWQAAQTQLPGECEGYVNCYLYLLRVTDGEYLNFYPGGKYARKSIQNITTLLEPIVADLKSKTVYAPPADISDRAEFNRLLTEMRAIISKVPFVEKARTIQQINQIGEGFR